MSILRVQHVAGDGEPRFQLVRVADAKTTAQVAIAPPVGFAVEGRPESDLVRELRWYLEDFLGYPFPPETEHADRVLAAPNQWGRQAFDALFDNRQGADSLRDLKDDERYRNLSLKIS